MEELLANLNVISLLISLAVLALVIILDKRCKRLNAENDLLIRTIELQGKIVDTLSWPKKEEQYEQMAPPEPFQNRVQPWLMECFGPMIAGDREERNHRFLEEALELVQSCGCSREEALELVEYVYGRPSGEKGQEVGGVMITLAALCLANDLNMQEEAERELARIWTKVESIRAKQAAKPKYSPLPSLEEE